MIALSAGGMDDVVRTETALGFFGTQVPAPTLAHMPKCAFRDSSSKLRGCGAADRGLASGETYVVPLEPSVAIRGWPGPLA